MSLFLSGGGEGPEGSSLDKIFEYKLPAKLDEQERDEHLIGTEIIAFLKWLVHTAPFKYINHDRVTVRVRPLAGSTRIGGAQFALPRRRCACTELKVMILKIPEQTVIFSRQNFEIIFRQSESQKRYRA
jgi:hypothetical protein